MKKQLAMIMVCIVFVASFLCANASGQDFYAQDEEGFLITFNGEAIEGTSIVHNNAYYVPVRSVFEKMGAFVFYRNRDHQILALSRDGDVIRHIVGENTMIVNGKQKTFETPSILENNQTYIPIDMVTASLCPDRILYDNQQVNIQKYLFNNEYHKVIKDVLDVCKSSNFYPERFERYIRYHVQMPACSMQEVLFNVNLGLDSPFYENVTTIEHPYELLVLVNKYHQLPANFQQYNLVSMNPAYTVRDGKQYLLAGVAYEKYIQMADAAKKEGLSMLALSTYRTEDYQRYLYNDNLRTNGKVHADNYSARPGHSEHQTGLAVDICSVQNTFEYTPEFQWLQEHAHEYGYILRYPKGKEWITGYAYEPWHYRYVGTDVAKIIHEEGITYEEYYAKYISVNEFK